MNSNVAVSRRYPARPWRQGVLVANARACKIAISSVLLLLVITAPVRAQAPAAPRATPHEAARPANAQDMFGWLRQFAPTQRRQSRVVSSPPLPRPRPAELTPTPIGPSPTSEEAGCTDASASFCGRRWGILRGELSRARNPGTAWGKAPCSEPCAGYSGRPSLVSHSAISCIAAHARLNFGPVDSLDG